MKDINNENLLEFLFEQAFIKVEKKFFGFMTKVTYTPTNSPVVGCCLEYSPTNGERVKNLINASPNEVSEIIQKEGVPEACCNGNILLSLCYSKDKKFAAMQLSQFSNFEYHPMGDICLFEGDAVQKMLTPFIK